MRNVELGPSSLIWKYALNNKFYSLCILACGACEFFCFRNACKTNETNNQVDEIDIYNLPKQSQVENHFK